MWSRRQLLAFGAALAAVPRRARAGEAVDRKFLFVYASGGWDPTYVFAPGLDPATVDGDPEGRLAYAGDIPFVDSASRPSVARFFERFGPACAVINGMEVRSLTHERSRQLVLCGSREGDVDDWPTAIAAGRSELYLPHLVLTGPAFAGRNASAVTRLGANDQLTLLLSGEYVDRATPALSALNSTRGEQAAAFARARAEAWAARLPSGRAATWGAELLTTYDRVELCRSIESEIAIGGSGGDQFIPVPDRVQAALRCFAGGYSRCAMVEHLGLYDRGWDSHSNNSTQGDNFELLFSDLADILDDLAATAGQGGGSLLDETTVVVLSEMGRTPRLNSSAGKDHWTYTSAMLIGAGVRGGQVVGAFDDGLNGSPVNLATGGVDASGSIILPEHLGATLALLAGLDPEALAVAEPLLALVEGA